MGASSGWEGWQEKATACASHSSCRGCSSDAGARHRGEPMETPIPTKKPPAPYAITESLSHGNGSTVYRAIRRSDGSPVVLKVLDPQRCGPKDVERLRNEIDVGKLLDSSAVIKALALESFEGTPALVFEDFRGPFLGELVGTPMPLDRYLPLAIAIAKA